MASEPGNRQVVRINFQDGEIPKAAGYLADNFLGYGLRPGGLTYGWVTQASVFDGDPTTATPINPSLYPDIAINERTGGVFDSYDPRLTGYAHFNLGGLFPQGDANRVAWELALEDGWYEVTASVGDTGGPLDSTYRLSIEGELASAFSPTETFRTELVTRAIKVEDGRLTLTAADGWITEIQYLEVRALPDLTPDDAREAPQDYASFRDLRAAAQEGSQVFSVDLAPNGGFASGVDTRADIILGISVVEGRGGVSFESLTNGSLRLYETLTGAEVAYSANTTAGSDSITISPLGTLKPNTSYTLVADGVEDEGPINDDLAPVREFQKLTTTFTTGADRAPVVGDVAFTDKLQINGAADGAFAIASIELSADGASLYAATLGGQILRWSLDPLTGAIDKTSQEVFAPGGDFDTPAGRRGFIGLTVDPSDPDVLWVTDNWPIPLNGRDSSVPEFSGRISKITLGDGGDLATATITPYVTGLPRSNGDHVTNSLEFRVNPDYDPVTNPDAPQHLLYVLQGSNSAMGAPDSAWGLRPERLLTAAVLEIDPSRTPPAGGFDVRTEPLPEGADLTAAQRNRRFVDDDDDLKDDGIVIDSGPFAGNFLHFAANGVASVRAGATADSPLVQQFYDPYAADAVLRLFATGTRNAYDLVWHSNGQLYVPTNGSAAGGNVPDNPATATNEGLTNVQIQPDYLFTVEEGGYYGHPNALHDEFILNGGNPTAGTDPNEVAGAGGYAVGIMPDPNYTPDLTYNLGFSRSPNGAIEFTSDVWGDALKGALLVTEYSGGNDIRALMFDASGRVQRDFVLRDFGGSVINRYVDPLDIVENPLTGRLYVSTLNRSTGESQIVLLDPAAPPDRVEAETLAIDSGFTIQSNTNASGGAFLNAFGSGEQRASMAFVQPTGVYEVTIGYFDETDGVSRLGLRVDGVMVDAFLWDDTTGNAAASLASARTRAVSNVFIEAGSTVEILGYQNAGEPLRVDFLEFAFLVGAPVGAAPVNAAPFSNTVMTGQTLAFTGANTVSVSDADSARVTTTLSVSNGAIALGATTGAVLASTSSGATSISGTVAQVNAALAGLTFTPTVGYSGPAAITIETTDGALTDTDVIGVTVNPFGNPDANIAAVSNDPAFFENRLHFSYIDAPATNAPSPRSFKDSGVVTVSNEGTAPLAISGFELDGPFQLANPAQLTNVTLQPGQSIDVTVNFDRAAFGPLPGEPGYPPRPNDSSSVFTGELRIFSNDQVNNVVQIDLAGAWQRIDEGGWEPQINEVWEVFGFGNRIPGLGFTDNNGNPIFNGGKAEAFDATEVISPFWKIADGVESATLTSIAGYAGPGSYATVIHRPFQKSTTAVSMSSVSNNSQTILPETRISSALDGATFDPIFNSVSFTRATIPDNWPGSGALEDVFAIATAGYSTENYLNPTGSFPDGAPPEDTFGHWLRIFQALDAEGNAIENVYLGIQDFVGINGDFNDNMFVIEGVAPVSRPPEHSLPAAVAVDENGAFAFTGVNRVNVTDPDAGLTLSLNSYLSVQNGVLTISNPGTATVTGSGTANLSVTGSAGAVSNALASLGYTPNAGFSGQDQLRIVTNDRTLSDEDFIAITVAPTGAAAPVNTVPATATVAEDGVLAFTGPAAVLVADADSASLTTTVSVADGALSVATGSGASVSNNGTAAVTLTGTATQINAALAGLTYAPAADFNGSRVITVATSDGALTDTDTITVTVTPVNDAPVNTVPATATVAEDGVLAFTGDAIVAVNDIDSVSLTTVVSVADGALSVASGGGVSGNGTAAVTLTGTATQINAALAGMTYAPAAGFNGERIITVATSDGALSDTDTIAVTVTPADNAAPVNTVPAAATVAEDGVLAFTGPSTVLVADADGDVLTTTVSVADGALSVASGGGGVSGNGTATVTLTGTATQINAALAGMTYAPAAGFNGERIITVATSDGALSDTDTIAVTVTPADNAAPVNTVPATATVAEDGVLAFTGPSAVLVADADGDTLTTTLSVADGALSVTTGGGGGVSNNGTATVTLTGTAAQINAALAGLTYTPVADFNGERSITVATSDGALSDTDMIAVTVTPVNDAPTVIAVTAPSVTEAGGASLDIAVTYFDDTGLNAGSFGTMDIAVTTPSGGLLVSGVAIGAAQPDGSRTVVYTVAAPGGAWDIADVGTYTVSLNAGEVFDTDGLAAAAQTLTTFDVTIEGDAPPQPFRIEAEAFTPVTGFTVVNNPNASLGKFLQAGGSVGSEQRAEYVFNQPNGVYDIGIGHFDENDGVSQLSLVVNGTFVYTFLWDQQLGTAVAAPAARAVEPIPGVSLRTGDVIELVGFAGGAEPLRTDFVDFAYVGALSALPPGVTFRVEAESLAIQQGFTIAEIGPQASASAVLEASGAGEQIATYTFAAAAGVYDIDLGYFDENDGEARMTVLVNGVALSPGELLWNEDFGSAFADTSTRTSFRFEDVTLLTGDVIELRGLADAGEPLRTDYLDFSLRDDVPQPPAPFRVEAETFERTQGFALASNPHASGGQLLQSGAAGGLQQAQYVFAELDGVYTLRLGYFDENDGVASMSVRVNGAVIDSFLWDQDFGSAIASPASRTERAITSVALRAGDVIELSGIGTASEPLRTDYLDFEYTGALTPVPPGVDFRVEAETIDIVQGFVVSSNLDASAGAYLQAGPAGGLQRAQYVFAAEAGFYDLTLGYFDEEDGVSAMTVLVNGVALGDGLFLWDAMLGSIFAETITATSKTFEDVLLKAGDVIELRGTGDGVEPLRTDYLDFALQRTVTIPDPFRVEAETFTVLQGFVVSNNGNASGGQTLQAGPAGGLQQAQYAFSGQNGVYDLSLGYFDENDGVASMSVMVNGEAIDSFVWNQNLGSAFANSVTQTERLIERVELREGDVIALIGNGDGGEPLRTDYLDFVFVDQLLA